MNDTDNLNDTENEDSYYETSDEDYDMVDDEEVIEGAVFQKLSRVQVADVDKIYRESIQRGDLHKYKIERVPRLRRNNEDVLNKINREVNNISFLKNSVFKDNEIIYTKSEHKPLIDKYSEYNFKNKLLIPLVINKKDISEPNSKVSKEEYDQSSNIVYDDYFKNIDDLNQILNKKSINYDKNIAATYDFINPTYNVDNDIGIIFRLGEGIDSDNLNKINQDSETIRYCNSNYKCQSYQLQNNIVDTQVNLGPVGRNLPVSKEEGDYSISTNSVDFSADNIDDNIDKNIYNIVGKHNINYPGDLITMIGFVRLPVYYYYLLNNIDKNELNLHNHEHLETIKNLNIENTNLEKVYNDCLDNNKLLALKINGDGNLSIIENNSEINVDLDEFNLLDYEEYYITVVFDKKVAKDDMNILLSKIVPSFSNIIDNYNFINHNFYSLLKYITVYDYEYKDLKIEDKIVLYEFLDDIDSEELKDDKEIRRKI